MGPMWGETHTPLTSPRANTSFEGHKSVGPRKTVPLVFGCQGLFPAASSSACRSRPAARGQPSLRWGGKALASPGREGYYSCPPHPIWVGGMSPQQRAGRAAGASISAGEGDPVGASEVTQRCAKQTRQRARRGRTPAPGVNSLTWQTSPEAPSTPTCTRRQEPTRIRRQEPTRRRTPASKGKASPEPVLK